MGGLGSGNASPRPKRTVERCICLSISDLKRWGLLEQRPSPLCTIQYEAGRRSGTIRLRVTEDYVRVHYDVCLTSLTSTSCPTW